MLTLDLNLPLMDAKYFAIHPAIKNAYNSLLNWAESLNSSEKSSLIIYGDKSSGKSSLLAIGKSLANQTPLAKVSIICSKFQNLFDIAETANLILILDDFDKILAGAENDNNLDLLFYLADLAYRRKISLLISAKNDISFYKNILLEDVLSRILTFNTTKIDLLDELSCEMLISSFFKRRQVNVSDTVVKYLISRTNRNYYILQRNLEELDKEALYYNKAISIDLIKDVLK